MKKKLITFTLSMALAAGTQAATLAFTSLRAGGAVNWQVDGGSDIAGATGTINTTTWQMTFTGIDILGDGGSYDGTVTIGVTTGSAYNAGSTRYNMPDQNTLTLATPTIAITDSAGSSNTVAANNLITSYDGFTAGFLQVTRAVDYSGTGITSGSGSGFLPINGAQDLTLFRDGSRTGYLFGVSGEFDVTVVPEPDSTALIGLGGLALILRRRK